MTDEILQFLQVLDVKEIHGYRPDLGLRLFSESALNRQQSGTAMAGAKSIGAAVRKGKKVTEKA
jgi:arginine decarboxylase